MWNTAGTKLSYGFSITAYSFFMAGIQIASSSLLLNPLYGL